MMRCRQFALCFVALTTRSVVGSASCLAGQGSLSCDASDERILSREHELFQVGSRSLQVVDHEESSQESTCQGMSSVEKVCSSDGCRALVTNMHGKTCQEYCAAEGRTCLGGWEEVDETCQVLAELGCDQTYDTSDLICECTAEEQSAIDSACDSLQNVERVCSANGCRVLADQMQDRTCHQYCSEAGLSCLGAWEEVNDDCNVKATLSCDDTWPGTSDLICECTAQKSVVSSTPAPNPVPESGEQPAQCSGLLDVERTCSATGCKVLADHMQDKSCREYCGQHGYSCIGAWEEVNDDCNAKETLTCDDTWPGTSDLMCECDPRESSNPPSPSPPQGQLLVWSDEFNGGSLDASKWTAVKAGGGFGNRELQFYTDSSSNMRLEGGILKIIARCEEYSNHAYTSAKLITKHKGDWGPGHRIEVRAKVPTNAGTWSAIWMMPTHNTYGGWPRSGEIDIFEAVGCTPNKVHGTVHTSAYNHMQKTQKAGHTFTDVAAWHTHSIEWSATEIVWLVDGQRYHSFAAPSSPDSSKWPFDQQFYLILNLAVGGTWGGWCARRPSCSSQSEFGQPQVMEVDYVRVFKL